MASCHRAMVERAAAPRSRGVGTPRVCRPAGYLPPGTVGQWLPVPCNGGPCARAASRKPTKQPRGLTQNSRAGNPKRTRPKLPPDGVLSNQRGLQRTKRGGGPKTPLCKGKGPENTGVVAPFYLALVVGATACAQSCVLRQGGRCPCCAVQQSSASTVSEPLRGFREARYIDDGRVSADNCEVSTVAWGPSCNSASAVFWSSLSSLLCMPGRDRHV